MDGKLIPRLKNLDVSTGNKRALIIREIFEGTNNYMKNGTILRQVINELNNLDIKNPHAPETAHEYSSIELVNMLHDSFRKSDDLLQKLKKELTNG